MPRSLNFHWPDQRLLGSLNMCIENDLYYNKRNYNEKYTNDISIYIDEDGYFKMNNHQERKNLDIQKRKKIYTWHSSDH